MCPYPPPRTRHSRRLRVSAPSGRSRRLRPALAQRPPPPPRTRTSTTDALPLAPGCPFPSRRRSLTERNTNPSSPCRPRPALPHMPCRTPLSSTRLDSIGGATYLPCVFFLMVV
ncbi:hypothetical protein PVAP13_3KG469354 [Panicum virgatum]|uniref:Uncharacterized protein n=1 Tax=Panicum virgatum TaxID=38727 RepID=A0A8T0UJI1_PANVG|nr:hypothetical protein PVAP13_3KG469354 [Panicum virgatum]